MNVLVKVAILLAAVNASKLLGDNAIAQDCANECSMMNDTNIEEFAEAGFALNLGRGKKPTKFEQNLLEGKRNPKKDEQRAFVILYIRKRGFLLMEAYKKSKGSHFQLPGGRIDVSDFKAAGVVPDLEAISLADLARVGQHAVLREIYEETKIDMHQHIERLTFLPYVTAYVAKQKPEHGHVKGTHLPRKLYYTLELLPSEFDPQKVTLSKEHIAFSLQPDINTAIKQTELHSGGDSARALRKYQREMEIFIKE